MKTFPRGTPPDPGSGAAPRSAHPFSSESPTGHEPPRLGRRDPRPGASGDSHDSPGSDLDPWYVTGLCEGAGLFTFSRSPSGISAYFAIHLTDPLLLRRLQEFFGGVGRLYEADSGVPAGRVYSGSGPSYYRVARCRDLLGVVAHFDVYPLAGRKRESYELWRELVELKNRFYRRPPPPRLEELARLLSGTSGGR